MVSMILRVVLGISFGVSANSLICVTSEIG